MKLSLFTGDTGPLVYPAGFVYIYSIFYFITSAGENIRLAQYLFIGIYLLQMTLVLRLYAKTRKLPPYVLVISAFTSYRIHSIYVLRLFNDPIAVLFLYAALNFYLDGRWTLGSIFFSLGVSVKMNILLFAPSILLLFIVNLGYGKTLQQLTICAVVQLLLGAPFLLTYPLEYIKGSFDLGRVFDHKWTVNYRFMEREHFEHKYFHLALLGLHIFLLAIHAGPCYKYMQNYCRLRTLQLQLQPQIDAKNLELKKKKNEAPKPKQKKEKPLTGMEEKFLEAFEKTLQKSAGPQKTSAVNSSAAVPEMTDMTNEKYEIFFDKATQLAILPIFLCNFIGIVCSRSLHYQFYVWYFHSLPYLIWFTNYSVPMKFLLLGLAEYSWNTYPSTNWSSFVLHLFHIVLMIGIRRTLCNSQQKTDKNKL